MAAGQASGAERQGPYFFLSYAHTPKHDPSDPQDPDKWVVDFYHDLCRDVVQLGNVPDGRVGFMDRELRSGSYWPTRLTEALATCRVFVPLYSARYFDSEHCGKEWFAFSRRTLDHTARGYGSAEAIVPALWVPVRSSSLPEAARSIQFDHGAFGERYSTHGLYGIMKLSRFRSDYEVAVYELAQRIVDVAHRTHIGHSRPADYDSLDSAFGPRVDRSRDERRMHVTVVAPDESNLPPGRGGYYYGQGAREWNPYRPHSARPLADHAAGLVRNLDYRPDVAGFDDHVEDLLREGAPTRPGLMLVDPWATLSAERRALLQRFDALDRPWIRLMVPWNRDDAQTADAEAELRGSLDASLGGKLAEGRLGNRTAVHGIPTLEQFGTVLPVVARAATRQYLKRATAYPPEGSATERPRLLAPGATPDPDAGEDR